MTEQEVGYDISDLGCMYTRVHLSYNPLACRHAFTQHRATSIDLDWPRYDSYLNASVMEPVERLQVGSWFKI